MYALPRIAPRSSSQPGRRSDRWQDSQRPSLLRQTTEASPVQRQIWSESAFQGNADYQLFAEATFGLSPDYPLQPSATSTGYFENVPASEGTEGETLRSIAAFRQLAQLPQTPDEVPPFRVASYSPPAGFFDAEIRQNSNRFSDPIRSYSFLADPQDDELPNYDQSQAEMHHRSRQQAISRAQELQRRWRESNRG